MQERCDGMSFEVAWVHASYQEEGVPEAPPHVTATPRGGAFSTSNGFLQCFNPHVRDLAEGAVQRATMRPDPAVTELLRLDPEQTTVSSAGGGSSFASTSKITTKLSDGTEKSFFMKTGKGEDAEVMFAGRHVARIA